MQAIVSHKNLKSKVFETVVPMSMTTVKHESHPRPRYIRCGECGGSGKETYLHPDTCRVEEMPCMYCNGAGGWIRNASHREHRSWLAQVAAAGLSVIKAVLL